MPASFAELTRLQPKDNAQVIWKGPAGNFSLATACPDIGWICTQVWQISMYVHDGLLTSQEKETDCDNHIDCHQHSPFKPVAPAVMHY
jgi:hypothetical protein